MRLFLLIALTMVAFAANSLLNRAALTDAGMGPAAFAMIRLGAGAAMLGFLVLRRSGSVRLMAPGRAIGAGSLALYIFGFSFAYVTLDAGVGALILFGGVQLTMFGWAVLRREDIPPLRWAGAALAFAGLIWLCWPGGDAALPVTGIALMTAAAFGWGVYSVHGRGSTDALGDTAANFILCVPLGVLAFALTFDGVTLAGLVLAILSGAVTSGLGYALWYSVLPKIAATTAAVAQLTVPVIALVSGSALLGEVLTPSLIGAALVVLAGVGLAALAKR
ncbi:MAG: DMT family transporter [Rhodobacteraceae bacterium]|nr:DMT family transporter [Paracoccaceae bacterium]